MLEQTERVLGERRFRTLRDLAALAEEARTPDEVCRLAVDVLARNVADVPFALLYVVESLDGVGSSRARLAGCVGLTPGNALAPTDVEFGGESSPAHPWPFGDVMVGAGALLVAGPGAC